MSCFKKGHAPASLRAWIRDNQPTTERVWDELGSRAKADTRTRLHGDQRGLCCYCYARVTADHTSRIEHIEAQNVDNRFDWNNLALACEGGNVSGNPHHCDHAKGDQTLQLVHPYKAPVNRFVRLGATKGQLKRRPDVDEAPWEHDIEHVLRLNQSHLQRLRTAALKALTAELERGTRRRTSKNWRMQDLQRSLDDLEQRANHMDYQPLIEDWLRDRLRRA